MEVGADALPDDDTRDYWSSLHLDALSLVFTKLDLFDILMGAGLVCHSWLDAAKVPSLWRGVDMVDQGLVLEKLRSGESDVLCAMAKLAVDRSCGQLQEFHGKRFVTAELLNYIGDRAPSLKTLRLRHCYLGSEEFTEAIKKFPLLEELEMFCSYESGFLGHRTVYELIAKACPHLKSFKHLHGYTVIYGGLYSEQEGKSIAMADDGALGIATMTGLRTLQLLHEDISNKGLTAILKGCPHLDSLDIRQCSHVKMDAAMKARLASIKSLRLPSEPMDDYLQELLQMP
ncbi:unnamed protein product [Urochloa decumbens]|uniref:F-box domain-containing protein n=1 Tax=Urochloa decumbens TaxID=240449 RepID=A0ABC9BQ88_9POAL